MEENLFGNSEKNAHPGFDALSEAEFKERRVVFMGAEEPGGSGEEAEGAAKAREGLDLSDPTQEALDKKARKYLTDRLSGPAQLAVSSMTIMEVKKDSSDKVTSVTAKMNGIRVTIGDEHSDDQISKFQADALKYKMQFTGLKFRDGSYVDISNEKASLLIEIDDNFEGATTDDLTVDIDVSTDTITDIRLDPSTSSEELRAKIDSLKGQPVAQLTRQVLQELVTLQTQASEAGVDRELATADGATEEVAAPAEGAPAEGTEEPPAESAAPAEGEETPLVVNLGELLEAVVSREISGDNFKGGEKITVPIGGEKVEVTVHKEGDSTSFTCDLPLFENVKIPFELKDDGIAVMTIGNRKITMHFEDGKITIEGLGKKGKDEFEIEFNSSTESQPDGAPATLDVKFKFNGKPVEADDEFDFVTLFGGEDNLKAVGFTPQQIAEMGSMPLVPRADMDDESERGADSAEDAVTEGGDTDKDKDKKRKGALERTFGREASENIGSFMETLEELAAVVLELLESLGFDLNPDKNKDGTTRTPAEREGRRLWLFIGRNQLGTKNRGKLQSMKMDELMALHHDKDQARTVAALEEAEFDVKGVHGEKLYEMLEHIHNIKDKDDRNKEDGKGAEKVKEYYVANGSRMNLNTFLFKTKMIDMNGRWSDGWEEFTGKTDEEIAAEQAAAAAAEATRTQERTDLKNNTTLKPEVMKRIVNAEKPDERNALAKKLQDMGALTDTTAIATYDASKKTPDDFRALLDTMTDPDKEEFFGGHEAVEGKWRDIKVELKKITPPGSTDADALADHLMGTDTRLKLGDTEITFTDKTKLTAALKKTVEFYDGKRLIEKGDEKVDPELTEAKFGIREDEIQKLFKYLHKPEKGEYTDEKIALRKEYALPASSAYTLADLIVAVFDIKLEEPAA